MANTQIVVLGGGYSGLLAARRLALKTRGQKVDITLVNGADHFVERIRLHQLAAHQTVKMRPFSKILPQGVAFVRGWATSLQADQHTLTVKTDDGTRVLAYDHLVYALGSFTDTSRVPGVAEHTLPIGAEALATKLRAELPAIAARNGRLIVVGGGLTGIESATEMAESYPALKVTLVTSGRLGEDLSAAGAAHVRRVFDRLGIEIIDQSRVTSVSANALQTESGPLAFDLCLWAGPFAVPQLAREAGLTVNALGQALVDPHLRSVSHPDITVVGDAADLSGAIEAPIRMACATALPMGGYAADELSAHLHGKVHHPYDYAYVIRCISLGRHNGLVQFVDEDDRPKETILKGWLAARVKEMICKFTVWQIEHERWVASVHHSKPEKLAVPVTSHAR